ncbi:Tether containing UBX domain for GLUT4 [Trichinella papuae]|uniref:Tether containing UBX domain for GLUT4 n=2 Tax=Trichinella papuae TaxID=268474 RepID=A0A0V1MYE0_9BILA|nr:Tether containing UBX domain for GLUT4 [Trichinella papuae]
MSVTIVYPTNHRLQFKISPNLTLYQILDEACLRKGLETADHALKFHSRILDLALTFRYSRIPINGTLEIVRREDEDIGDHQNVVKNLVKIAVQFTDGTRVSKQVEPDSTLLQILKLIENDRNQNLVKPDGEEIHPVVVYLNTEAIVLKTEINFKYATERVLEMISLKSLGIHDQALFRYFSRRLDDSKLKQIDEFLTAKRARLEKLENKICENNSKPLKIANNCADRSPLKSERSLRLEKLEKMIAQVNESLPASEISDCRSESNFALPKVPCERKLIIYKQEDHLPVLEEPDDAFFEVTKSDVMLMQKRLKENCDLLTKTCLSTANNLKQQETERRRKSYLYSVVRIHLPGRWTMQATFYSSESVEDLYQFVSSLLKNPNTAFELYQAPKYLIKRTDSTLFDAGLSPMALLILKVKDASITKAEQLFNEEWLKTEQGDKSVAVAHVHQSFILNAEHLAQSKTGGQH